jgi:hypothetical protein
VRSLQWGGDRAGAAARTIVALPLFDDERPGSLRISTQADESHQASLTNWLRREVAQTVGLHLARTADLSPAGSARGRSVMRARRVREDTPRSSRKGGESRSTKARVEMGKAI